MLEECIFSIKESQNLHVKFPTTHQNESHTDGREAAKEQSSREPQNEAKMAGDITSNNQESLLEPDKC